MAHRATSNPSDHPTTAAALEIRGLQFRDIGTRNEPPNWNPICEEFRQVVTNGCRRTNETIPPTDLFTQLNLEGLRTIMTNHYATELDFDEALFKALRGCLTGYCVQGVNKDYIILNGHLDNEKYAVGFARQVRPALELVPFVKDDGSTSQTGGTGGGLEALARSDHSICIFEKVGNGWKVKECFGIIELKMSDTGCRNFIVGEDREVIAVDLKSDHGALGQEILYTIGSVVLYHARNGILEPSVPLAVIAGIRTPKPDSPIPTKLRWVSGLLHIPEVRGNRFEFSVEDFGGFHYAGTLEESQSATFAMRLYLDTMLFGLKLAIGVRDKLNAGDFPLPVPASGHRVKIGQQELDLTFCASPIPGARIIDPSWKISQGELFWGYVNLHGLLEQDDLNLVDLRPEEPKHKNELVKVLVKVSSLAVHNLLITPSNTMNALLYLKLLGGPRLIQQIGDVVYAFLSTDIGLVTIMSDQCDEGYTALEPNLDDGKHLSVLWAGFSTLVKTVLLPLAKKTIIHPDIRPGYDVTYNILHRLGEDDTTTSMRLIDLESLVFVKQWTVPRVKGVLDGRFLLRFRNCNATTYVWWQCLFVAYVWTNEIPARNVEQAGVVNFLKKVLLGQGPINSDWPDWLVNLRRYTANGVVIDESAVESTLDELATLFTQNETGTDMR